MTTTNMFLNFGGKWDSPPLGISRAVLTLVSSLESSVAPQSSSLGTVRGLRGATFVLEATKDTTGG